MILLQALAALAALVVLFWCFIAFCVVMALLTQNWGLFLVLCAGLVTNKYLRSR